jgi:hypothetical protein
MTANIGQDWTWRFCKIVDKICHCLEVFNDYLIKQLKQHFFHTHVIFEPLVKLKKEKLNIIDIQAALVIRGFSIRGFDYSRAQKPRITRENCLF